MRLRYSQEVNDLIKVAKHEALASGSTLISPIHLVLALSHTEGHPCNSILAEYGFDPPLVRKTIRVGEPIIASDTTVLSITCEAIIKNSTFEAFLHHQNLVHPIHVLLTMFRYHFSSDDCIKQLQLLGLNYDCIQTSFLGSAALLDGKYRRGLSRLFANRLLLEIGITRLFVWP